MKPVMVIGASLVAGFLGGILGMLTVRAREQTHPAELIRARSFEIVNVAGQAISYWGVDNARNAVLAFADYWPPTSPGGKAPLDHPLIDLRNPHNQQIAIGVLADSPYLELRDKDGKTRARLDLNIYEKPGLVMLDEGGYSRVLLGIEQSDTPGPQDNNWALDFYPERASIGVGTQTIGGQTYVWGHLEVNKGRIKYPYSQPK